MLRKISVFFLTLLLFLSWNATARAGFGVSPPTITNTQLTPGSIYKQQIMLLRSSADEELKVKVKINATEIESWMSIDRGEEFMLPKGELQVPMVVTFKIPKGAELGNYTGNINVRIAPADDKGGGVAIALGARIDINLSLTNVSYADFLVRVISIPDFERLGAPWSWKIWSGLYNKLFYKIRVVMSLENKGNVKVAPSKVAIEVWDLTKKDLLEKHEDKKLDTVKPFSTGEVTAKFSTKLPVGQYWAKIKVYKGQEVVNFYEIAFSVAKPGALGSGARSLGIWPWLLMLLLVLIAGAVIFWLIKIRAWRFFIFLVLLPSKPVLSIIGRFFGNLNKGFWRWVNKQAEKHRDDTRR